MARPARAWPGTTCVALETVIAPRKLHSKQQIRTANYVLQTSDPSGINAAGKGSNVGQGVVIHYAAEILRRAWDTTGEARYLAGIEERAAKMLDLEPKFTDDLAHRVLFFRRVFPADYASLKGNSAEAQRLVERAKQQVERDERALARDRSATTARGDLRRARSIPMPTPRRPRWRSTRWSRWEPTGTIRPWPAASQALLKMQHPYGLWNRSARTGFVTTSYVLHTLSRLYPDAQPKLSRQRSRARSPANRCSTRSRGCGGWRKCEAWSAAATDELAGAGSRTDAGAARRTRVRRSATGR